jgi:hypothetical protein
MIALDTGTEDLRAEIDDGVRLLTTAYLSVPRVRVEA